VVSKGCIKETADILVLARYRNRNMVSDTKLDGWMEVLEMNSDVVTAC